MELKTITQKEFDAFAYNQNRTHFMQTSAWGEVNKKRGLIVHHLGLFENDVLKGACLLLEKKILIYSYFYCPRGFLIDYSNETLIKAMLEEVTKYTKKHHGLYVRFDPDLIIHKLDKDAKPIETFEDHLKLIETFQKYHAKHKGFTIRFSESSNPRFTFRLKLDKPIEELFNNFHPTTKNILKRNNPYGLKIYKGNSKDVLKFYETMVDTAHRKKIYLEPLSFFQDFYDVLNQYEMSDVYIASLNIKELKEVYQTKLETLQKEIALIDTPNATKRQKSKLLDLNDQVKKCQKEMALIQEITQEELILTGVITAKYKDKVWIVHGGNSDILKFVNANYEVYYQVIKDAKEEGYDYVDFFGSEGKVDPKSDLYGIYLFKLRFGGDFDEFIGEFDIITKPIAFKIIMTLLHIRRRIKIKLSR